MSAPSRLLVCIAVLGALHLGVACAGFFAPYDPEAQDRAHPYAPPMRPHFVDEKGGVHLLPFFYAQELRAGSFDQYEENRVRAIPVRFFVTGASYHVLGVLPLRIHLFGSDDAPLYLLGSDEYGRDLLSRILVGGQVSLLAGLIGAGLTLSIGLCVGTVAGFLGGWKDEVLMRIAELFLALPWIYLLFAMRAFLPLTVPPLKAFLLVVMVIAAVGWARPARVVRASVVLTQAAILVPQFVLAEMTLSFLGLGVPEPVPSWGNMLASLQHYNVLVSYWWMYLPAVAMVPFFLGYLVLASLLQVGYATSKMDEALGEI